MLYLTSRLLIGPAARAIWRPTITGRDHVPTAGGVLLASNHLSFVDSVVIPLASPRPVHFLAKADYFTGSGVRGAAVRSWMTAMGMIPVERDDRRASMESLDIALRVLREGKAFGIYPEGTRSRDGRIYRGRTGVAHLAMEADVPVVPVGLRGTPDIQPVGSNRLRRAHCTIAFGEPLTFRDTVAGLSSGKARRVVTDQVMAAIQELSGQESAGVYNERPAA